VPVVQAPEQLGFGKSYEEFGVMSLTKNDRKHRSKSGNSFPTMTVPTGPKFVAAVADALRAEFGNSAGAAKRIGRLTASNERAGRNWLDGKNGPSAENLVALMSQSDHILRAVLDLAGRSELTLATDLSDLRRMVRRLLQRLDHI
jgi:hypothetical protein